MAKKNSSLIVRIFTWVIVGLLVAFTFIPTINIQGDLVVGSDRLNQVSVSVSMSDVLSVAFMSDEAKEERIAEIAKEEIFDDDATALTKNKEYVLLRYFTSDVDDGVLGLSASTWLLVLAILQIAMFVALALTAFYSYMCMQYDNVTLPKWNKIFALVSGVLGVLITAVLMLCVKDNYIFETKTIVNVLGYIFAGLSIYLPLHVMFVFKGRKSYMDSKKK